MARAGPKSPAEKTPKKPAAGKKAISREKPDATLREVVDPDVPTMQLSGLTLQERDD